MKRREEYIEELHKKIDQWNREIDNLMKKGEEVDVKTRQELQEQIGSLRGKRDEIEQKVSQLQRSGSEAFHDLRSGLDLAGEAMNTALQSAFSRFRK